MAEPINLRVTAKDDASKTLDDVKSKADALDGASPTIDVTASDGASDVLDADLEKAEELDGSSSTIDVEADDNAADVLDADAEKAEELDGMAPTIDVEVEGEAENDLESIADKADDIDGLAPTIEPEVDTSSIDTAAERVDALGAAVGFLGGKLSGSAGDLGKFAEGLGLAGTAAVPLAGGVLAAGAAAFKVATDFQNLALQAQAFATAAGTSVEDASRWIEVAGDLGVNAEAVQSAVGRMNKNIASGKVDLAEWGVTAGDTSGRFVGLLQRLHDIPDATQRAAMGSEAFGKAWQFLAPLIADVSELPDRLNEVADAQVVTPEKVKLAKDFRDTMDDLGDALKGIALDIGKDVIPSLNLLATAIKNVTEGTGLLGLNLKKNGGFGNDFARGLSAITGGTLAFDKAQDDANKRAKEDVETKKKQAAAAEASASVQDFYNRKAQEGAKATADATDAATKQAAAVEAATQAAQDHIDAMERETAAAEAQVKASRAAADSFVALGQAQDKQADFLAGLNDEIKQAGGSQQKLNAINREAINTSTDVADALVKTSQKQAEQNGTNLTLAQSQQIWNQSMLTSASTLSGPMQAAVVAYIGQVNNIPPEKLTEIQAAIDRGDLAEAERLINETSRNRASTINVDANTSAAERAINGLLDEVARAQARLTIGANAMAGSAYTAGGVYRVGEAGPETVVLPGGAKVLTAGRTAMMGGDGGSVHNTYNITVNVPIGTPTAEVGRYVTDAVDAFERRSGRRRRAA